MLQALSTYVTSLLYVGATLSFVSPLVARNFYVIPDVPKKPFSVTTPVGDFVVARRVFRRCPISLPNRITIVELIELHMVNFYVILGMCWLHSCFAFIDYRIRVVKLQLPNEPVVELNGGKSILGIS